MSTATAIPVPPVLTTTKQAPEKPVHYLLLHWRGDLPLGHSYWINGALVTGAFAGFGVLLASHAENMFGLRIATGVLLLFYVTSLFVTVWQFTGIWHSSSKHVDKGGTKFWAVVAKLMVVLAVIRCGLLLTYSMVPQGIEFANILRGDTGLPAYTITALADGTEVEFRGGIRAGSADALGAALAKWPKAKVLHINSIGGRVSEAKAMMRLVEDRSLITYTSDHCLSAATLVLMAGKERVIATGAKVGFHAGSLPGATGEQQTALDAEMRTVMESANLSEDFINRVIATPNDEMWYPTYEEMVDAGVVTSQTLGDRFAASMLLAGVADKDIDAMMSKKPVFARLKEMQPEVYEQMLIDFKRVLSSGKSEGEAAAVIGEAVAGLLTKYTPSASDEALLAMRDYWIEVLLKYKDSHPRQCIAVFTGEKINFARALPNWSPAKMSKVIDDVVMSGAGQDRVAIDTLGAQEDLEEIFEQLRDTFGDDVAMLEDPTLWRDNPEQACELLVAYYQQIASLPDQRDANLLRYILVAAE